MSTEYDIYVELNRIASELEVANKLKLIEMSYRIFHTSPDEDLKNIAETYNLKV